MNRPLGVTLLAILHVVQAVLALFVGVVLVALGALLPRFFIRIPRRLGGVVEVIGVIILVVAFLYLVLAYGLWSGKSWAWIVSLILAGLGIIFSLLALLVRGWLAILALILDAVIIYYLLQPKVKAFFGEAKITPSAPPPVTSIPTQPQPMNTTGAKFCPNCGAPLISDTKFCSHCGNKLS